MLTRNKTLITFPKWFLEKVLKITLGNEEKGEQPQIILKTVHGIANHSEEIEAYY